MVKFYHGGSLKTSLREETRFFPVDFRLSESDCAKSTKGTSKIKRRTILVGPTILHTNSGCGKREAHTNWSMVTCQGSTRSELP